jgi:leucyl/phenylalanyl-tRNA--protein transferase
MGEAAGTIAPAWLRPPQAVGESTWMFPPPSRWPDDDVIAIGADLEPATIIAAYRRGIFPMELHGHRGLVGWWAPDPRGILPLDQLHVTASMRQSAKRYEIRIDTCFADVIRGCANPARERGWITPSFIDAYTRLHRLGWAHSVEAFDRNGELSGGLYGIRINRFFAGESMFHVGRDASKVALMALVDLMRASGMTLLDVQWCSEHLASLGAIAIPRHAYLVRLADALRRPSTPRRQKHNPIGAAR